MDEYLIGFVREFHKDKIVFEWNKRAFLFQGVQLHLLPQNQEIKLYIYFYQRLPISEYFAFLDQETKQYFLALMKINYLGPKLSLRILNAFLLSELQTIIITSDTERLVRVKGVTNRLAIAIIGQLKNNFFQESISLNKKN